MTVLSGLLLTGCGPDKREYPPQFVQEDVAPDGRRVGLNTERSLDRLTVAGLSQQTAGSTSELPLGFPTGVFVDSDWSILGVQETEDAKGFQLDAMGFGPTETIMLQIRTAMAGQGWTLSDGEEALPTVSRLSFSRGPETAEYSIVSASTAPTIRLVVRPAP
jgi:hypothetical protein